MRARARQRAPILVSRGLVVVGDARRRAESVARSVVLATCSSCANVHEGVLCQGPSRSAAGRVGPSSLPTDVVLDPASPVAWIVYVVSTVRSRWRW